MLFKPFMREAFMPLPVCFISTISQDGVRNIAPYGCVMPILRPLDLVAVATAKKRDTLQNIRETGQFVLNLAGEGMADKVIPAARHVPPEVDEFELAGLSAKPSRVVRAPGIAECFGWMECELAKEYEEERYILLVGKVLSLEIKDEVLDGEGSLDPAKARPLLITGSRQGMNFNTLVSLGRSQSHADMFPNGKDPLAPLYESAKAE